MYQPEISTLYENVTYFSPNAIVQIIDSHEVALGISRLYAPEQAQGTYNFARSQYGRISGQYLLDGTRIGGEGAANEPSLYAFMARLAIRMGDIPFAERLVREQMLDKSLYEYSVPMRTPEADSGWFFRWSSVLLAIRELQDAQVP